MAGVDGGEVITRGKIFISYRRDDDPGFALLVNERLEQEFGGANLFMDVEGQIKPGDDFVKVINDQVAQCDVLLAIIGERWIGARDADGNRRLEKESDFVRIEIASALTLGKRVIPVLVNKAEMPRADELPESLKLLARRNAVAIRPTRFKADSQGLVKALKDALAAAELERAAKTEAERKAAEEERKRREAEEEARAAQVEAAATGASRADAGGNPQSQGTRELGFHQGQHKRRRVSRPPRPLCWRRRQTATPARSLKCCFGRTLRPTPASKRCASS